MFKWTSMDFGAGGRRLHGHTVWTHVQTNVLGFLGVNPLVEVLPAGQRVTDTVTILGQSVLTMLQILIHHGVPRRFLKRYKSNTLEGKPNSLLCIKSNLLQRPP